MRQYLFYYINSLLPQQTNDRQTTWRKAGTRLLEWRDVPTYTETVVVWGPPARLDALPTAGSRELVSSSTRQRTDCAVGRRARRAGRRA